MTFKETQKITNQ